LLDRTIPFYGSRASKHSDNYSRNIHIADPLEPFPVDTPDPREPNMKRSTTILATTGLILGGAATIQALDSGDAGRAAPVVAERSEPVQPSVSTLECQYPAGSAANISRVVATAWSELPPLTSSVANAISPR
jgi:hypothetical protein